MNEQIFYFFYSFAHRSEFGDSLIVFVAHTLPYFVIILAMFFLLMHHEVFSDKEPVKAFLQKWREIIFSFFTSIFAWFMAYVLKILIHHPRPFLALPDVQALLTESDYSFPSGHATFYIALAFSIYLIHKKAGSVFIIFALFIGIARISAGVHYPLDILGGFVLGILVAYSLKKYFFKKV
ncbi:MAG: phosphatase PAP2 family protein [bacterium]|nr:phosphatase PAP2 family protein [bacterium]